MSASNNDDWRLECDSVIKMQNKARKEARFTDITFVIGEGTSKKEFHAHKSILACGSPVFEKMFYGGLAEKRSVIEIDDDPEAFDMLLNYMYGKLNEMTSLISVWKYFTIGDKYLITGIQKIAEQHIESMPFKENDFWKLIEDNIISSPIFFNKLRSYMMENAHSLIVSENFLDVPEVVIDAMLQTDRLNIEEYELLIAVTKWGLGNINQADNISRTKFYKYIRFSTLTKDEFLKFLDSYPKAIDAESSLEVLLHLHDKTGHDLPKWCSTIQTSRNKEFKQRNRYNFIRRDSKRFRMSMLDMDDFDLDYL